MHRAILSSTQTTATRSAAASRRLLASASPRSVSRNAFSSCHASNKASQARLPLHQQKNKSTLAIPQTTAPQQQQSQRLSITRDQMSSLFWSAAIPMVGFGFMDNFIMITAGSAIDNSLGVQMGLATMTAAAIGQVVSDVSGVVFGDTMAKVVRVKPANLTKAQAKLKLVSRIKLGGAVLGVIAGCTLGAVALWLVPDRDENTALSSNTTTATTTQSNSSSSITLSEQERMREQLDRLQKVMADIMTSQDDAWHERRASCTLYVNESMGDCIPAANTISHPLLFDFGSSRTAPASIEALRSEANNDPEVLHTLKEGRVVVFANTIYVPVRGDESESVLGIFKIKLENGSFYTGTEIKDAKKVARNLGFFLNRMV